MIIKYYLDESDSETMIYESSLGQVPMKGDIIILFNKVFYVNKVVWYPEERLVTIILGKKYKK